MPNVSCDVTNCANNCNHGCCRPIIKVEGHSAHKNEETCCQNFVKNGSAPTSNVPGGYQNPNEHLTIKCAAVDCKYNRNKKCDAPAVDIGGCGADDCKQTLCRTFVAK